MKLPPYLQIKFYTYGSQVALEAEASTQMYSCVLKVTDGLRNRYGSFSLFINELQIREDQNRFPCFEIPHIKFRLIALASLK